MQLKNRIALLLVLTVLCLGICACRQGDVADQTETVGGGTTVEVTLAETQTDTETAEPAETEPAITVQLPIDIETDGGVVIIGMIDKDDGGWYIRPEQPLNITFEYFLDNPTEYSEQTRIQMYDPSIDGVEKSVYIGKTVTVEGVFRYYRDDFETLYFMPYAITVGKNAAQCHAAPELIQPMEPENLYDPTAPLSKYMDPMIDNGAYIYNAFILSRETLEFMGNDFATFFVDFIDAFLNYREECPCPDKRYALMLSTVLEYECALYNACAEQFEYVKDYDPEKGTVAIRYRYERAEFDRIVSQFFDEANAFLSAASPDQTDEEKARNIYHALSSAMTYDYVAMTEWERKECYYAFLNHSGVCVTFASAYDQLLTQVGIQTTLAHSNAPDTIGHTWSVVTLNGEQYFCDPTYELSYDNGTGYRFFGMNYADRTADGLGAQGIFYGRYYHRPMTADMLAAESLQK